jgi:hypothetical protein
MKKPALTGRNSDSSELISTPMPDEPAQPKLGPWGGKRVKGERVSDRKLKGGTNRTYLIARLERDRPDLAAQVEAREMSAFAVAVELGWVRRRRTVAVHQTWRPAAIDIGSLIA